MTDREKLIELLKEGECGALSLVDCSYCKYDGEKDCSHQLYADVLIANGVVVQQWIPVTDRVPENSDDVIVCHKNGWVTTNAWLVGSWWYKNEVNPITHWMPLPEPPKEVE